MNAAGLNLIDLDQVATIRRRLAPAALRAGLGLLAVGAGVSRAAAEPGNAAHGKQLFQQNCALCHATSSNSASGGGQGPIIGGVVGRTAGTAPGFGYSAALRSSHLTWDAATLDKFLSGPSALVPGTIMPITVAQAPDRSDLIAYLATLPKDTAPSGASAWAGRKPSSGDWTNDYPGARHIVVVANLPRDFASPAARNAPSTVDRPAHATLAVPAGFAVKRFASGLSGPRLLRVAPNGDIFVAETRAGQIRVLRAADGADEPSESSIFTAGLTGPFGIAFYPLGSDPKWVYVANLNSVVRFPYHKGDLQASGPAETIVPQLAGTTGGHSTRDVVFSQDGQRLFISVGSGSNVAETMVKKTPEEIRKWEASRGRGAAYGNEANRADILVTDPNGRSPLRVFALGIRNPVGLAIQPSTGDVWCSTNERDGLGDDLVPDYITHVREGRYYGWPWYYMGNHEDPRHPGERPDLAGATVDPDVPVQAHSASLQLTFYNAQSGVAAFPKEYRGDVFAAFHGSWNRAVRTGSKVVRVLLRHGKATGEYEDFLTGFVVDNGDVWGRPVGVAVAHDGALLVSEDVGGTLWRIAYVGPAP